MSGLITLRNHILVRAPIERCFLLSTSVEFMQGELGLRAAGSGGAGLIGPGDTLLWEGWHGHQTVVREFKPPQFFRDESIAGRFACFWHDHHFWPQSTGEVLISDEICFRMPWGSAGRTLGTSVIRPRLKSLLRRRLCLLKQAAESEHWRYDLPRKAA